MTPPINLIISHGWNGSPEGNWFPWLSKQFSNEGHRVFVPRLPTPNGQSLGTWISAIQNTLAACEPARTILVGHSIGAAFVLRLAEKTATPFRAIYPICPFTRFLGLTEIDAANKSFIDHPFDWDKVRRGAKKIVCFAGDDDPYVPLKYAQQVANNMQCDLIIIPQGKHLNADSGYTTFPQLLDSLMELTHD